MLAPLTCTIAGCDRPQRARGWCSLHWDWWKKRGDPEAAPTSPTWGMTSEERLLHYTRKTDSCWLWEGACIYSGYGVVCWREFDTPFVHRIAYMLWIGEIPGGYEIDHLCFVRHCINPEHLEAVSGAENKRRRWERYRLEFPDCVKCGADDWRIDGRGRRQCRPCGRRKLQEWRAKQRTSDG